MKNQFNTLEWQSRFRKLTTDIKQQKTVLLLDFETTKADSLGFLTKIT